MKRITVCLVQRPGTPLLFKGLKHRDYQIEVLSLQQPASVLKEAPDLIVCVANPMNLENDLYLALQLMETGLPLIIAIISEKRERLSVSKDRLSELLGVPIIDRVDELLDEIIKVTERGQKRHIVSYGAEIEEEIAKIEKLISEDKELVSTYPEKWIAIKLLEDDEEMKKRARESFLSNRIFEAVEKSKTHIEAIFGDSPGAIIADRRYGFVSGACSEAVVEDIEARHSISDAIDKVFVNRVLGLPLLFGIMWLVFSFTFRASRPFVELIGDAQARLKELILSWGKGLFSQLLADGIIGGVGTVLSLVPVIFLLFFAISLLEDSGYMARAAFVMDTFLHKIGLHSTSFIPMLLGFSCNLPAIMATKMIRDRNSRLVTILVIPFMSCGARLPVYVLLISAFFGEGGGSVLFSIYLIGIATALIAAKLFRRHLLKGEAEPFIMELPPYRVPTMRGLVTHMWERGFIYIRKASLPIFVGCMLLWLLSNFPDSRENYLVMIGRCIAPVFSPLGFSDWRIASALLSGVFGKEIIVGALGVLYPDLTAMELTPLSAYSLMVFVLLYTPCLPTLIMIKRETESFFWTLFALLYTTTVAWTISFGIYTIGRLF